MELHVVDTEGVPEGCILSIRAGSTRRQAPMASDRPFRFPVEPSEASPFKLDVLEPVATARFILRPGDEKRTDSQFSLPLEAAGSLQEKAGGNVAAAGATERQMGLTFAVAQDASSSAAPDAPEPEAGEARKDGASSSSRTGQVAANREYLDKHNLVEFTQQLVQALIKEQPDRPYAFMASHFSFPEPEPRRRLEP